MNEGEQSFVIQRIDQIPTQLTAVRGVVSKRRPSMRNEGEFTTTKFLRDSSRGEMRAHLEECADEGGYTMADADSVDAPWFSTEMDNYRKNDREHDINVNAVMQMPGYMEQLRAMAAAMDMKNMTDRELADFFVTEDRAIEVSNEQLPQRPGERAISDAAALLQILFIRFVRTMDGVVFRENGRIDYDSSFGDVERMREEVGREREEMYRQMDEYYRSQGK